MIEAGTGPRPHMILVCSDGSPASQGVFEAAFTLAPRWPARVRLLQVLEYNPAFASLAIDSLDQWEQEAREGLQAQLHRAHVQGLEADILVSRGPTASRTILAEADRCRPDLIIMGRRGRTDVKAILMGSVTAKVIGLSPFPVLVVPRLGPFTFRRFLLATDGSRFSEAAGQAALALAKAWSVQVIAVSVAQKDEELPEVEKILKNIQEEADRQEIALSTFMVQGRPAEALVRAALLLEADLIILGSHGRTGLTRLLMGSVAEQVVGQASCPILVVKPRE